MAKAKGKVKKGLTIAGIALASMLLLGSIVGLSVKVDRQTTTERIGAEAYSIGVINSVGDETSANTSIISKAITVDGLKCDLKDDAKITYKLFFYDKEDVFISATESLKVDYDGSAIPSTAERVRIMITPTDDQDGSVSIFEKSGYADQLKVTVSR